MLGAMFTFEKRFTYEDGTAPIFYALMDGKKLPCLRFHDHYRPNNVHIFELGNGKKVYTKEEIEKFKKIFYMDIVTYLDPLKNSISFQNKKVKELLSYNT